MIFCDFPPFGPKRWKITKKYDFLRFFRLSSNHHIISSNVFGMCLGTQRSFWKHSKWFLINFRPPGKPKNIEKTNGFKHFCIFFMIALETDLGAIWVPFWIPKSSPNRSKIGSEPSQNSCSFLNAIQYLQKSIFGPTWPQLDPREAAKRPPRAGPKRSENDSKTVQNRCWQRGRFRSRSWTDFGPIWDRFWTIWEPYFDHF